MQYDLHPYKQGTFGHRPMRGESECGDRDQGDIYTSQETLKIASKPKLGERYETDFPSRLSEGHVDFGLWTSRIMRY